MNSNDFPSGPWTGFYQYSNGQQGWQDLLLKFDEGRMSGSGNDELGGFVVEGTYNQETKDALWLKSYPDGHRIQYRGFREGPVPGIWGTWEIPGNWSGGFHIWPIISGTLPEQEAEASVPLPIRHRELETVPA
ncbi:hypothetical protein EI77_04461 [Prosthecobacter fusiformis]|uniref:Uncharacterized protein n=1 Tax=Prosthecobacter fusiformis TaxID=48464 RepID=A0A4V3FE00_9BACT|nr:hypothetical protein [Prosthecobacter fusiformis]TDU63140.1 hypothetical protein EI77_04461 [Prosthecobacter fusiformis]